MIKRVTLHAQINTFTGYGLIISEVFKRLEARGCYVTLRAIKVAQPFGARIPLEMARRISYAEQPEEWELLINPPLHMPTPGKKTIYWSMWESTRLPARSVGLLNKAEIVVVPCSWCKKCFKESGVTRPIVVIPLGFDNEIFKATPMLMDGPCVFGAAGRLIHGGIRKGVNEVIQCFRDAFTRNFEVQLNVKAHPDDPVTIVDDPRIRVDKTHFTEAKLAEWLSGLTCFVSAARGEGFGLWQLQSMACWRPVIAPIYSGPGDFMYYKNSYPVRFEEKPAEGSYTGQGDWAHPDFTDMISQMRRAYLDRREARIKGMTAGLDVAGFTWDESVRLLHALLTEAHAI